MNALRTVFTVTFSPCIDYYMNVPELQIGQVNRSASESLCIGGKGVNVAMVLTRYGIPCVALGFIAGVTGQIIESIMKNSHIKTDFIQGEGLSRINIKLKNEAVTEINGQGVSLNHTHLQKLFKQLDTIPNGSVLVLAGSVPPSVPTDVYEQILMRILNRRILTVVDATHDFLTNTLKYHPFLIKPNHLELGEIFGTKITSEQDIIFYAKKLQELGARNVFVSRAGDGGVLLGEDGQEYYASAPNGTIVNSVGAGDSLVAGFIAEYLRSGDIESAFYHGLASGSACAFREGLATPDDTLKILKTFYLK